MESKRIDVNITYQGQYIRGNYVRESNKAVLADLYNGVTAWIPKSFLQHCPEIPELGQAESWEGQLPHWFNLASN